jgi:hypothetical protein
MSKRTYECPKVVHTEKLEARASVCSKDPQNPEPINS